MISLADILAEHAEREGPLLPILHDVQKVETRPVLKLCRAEACKARGVEALVPVAEGQTRVKVEPIYCLGLCSVGPAALVGETVHARLDSARLTALLASV
jgi:formate dehydrogenase subunit gamma